MHGQPHIGTQNVFPAWIWRLKKYFVSSVDTDRQMQPFKARWWICLPCIVASLTVCIDVVRTILLTNRFFFFVPEKQLTHLSSKWRQKIKFCFIYINFVLHIISPLPFFFFFDGATARGGPWPPLQYAPKPLDPLLCLSIRFFPSFSGPWTRHPAISFLVFLFVFLHTAFRTSFWNCGVLHSFYMTKPSYSSAFYKPDNVLPLNYSF